METNGFAKELMVRSRNWFGENLVSFHMDAIIVDDIPSSVLNRDRLMSHHSSPMVSTKPDADFEEEDEDGFVIGSPAWTDPYYPVPMAEGEIDDEVWFYADSLVGKNSRDYEYYKGTSDGIKASNTYLARS